MRAKGLLVDALVVAVLMAVGLICTRQTTAFSLRRVNLDLAMRVDDGNAQVLAARAVRALEPSAQDIPLARRLAVRALRRDATLAAAASVVGLADDLQRNRRGAGRAFAYAQRLSRRDLPTQLWLLESAVARGDVGQALRHYDTALRTQERAPELLFPVLIAATSAPNVRDELSKLLASGPDWAPSFLNQLTASTRDLTAAGTTLISVRTGGGAVPSLAYGTLIQRLYDSSDFAGAWRVYRSWRPHKAPAAVRDPTFRGILGMATVFDWSLAQDNGLWAAVAAQDGAGLAFSGDAATFGVIARQLVLLPPGRYRMRVGVRQLQGGQTPPYISLRCVASREIGRVALRADERIASGPLTVSGDCPAQWIELWLPPGNDLDAVSGHLSYVSVVRE